jgi:twinkle protein
MNGEAVSLQKRGIDIETCQKYKYLCGEDDHGRPVQLATYFDKEGRQVAQKVRYPDKKFRWTGEPQNALLFGQQLWGEGGRRIVVTEGEIDALSVAQVQGLKWPVVSVPNGAQGARKDLAKHIEYLETFDEVVLMFDQDESGEEAAAECAELFTPGKCRIAQIPLKDPNEMLLDRRVKALVTACWEAKVFRPDGLVLGADLWDLVSKEPEQGLSYPWECLNAKTYGMRRREIVTWSGGTGTGKSSLVREVAHHLAKVHKEKVGIIALEESVKFAALSQMSISADLPLHLPPVRADVSPEEFRRAFDASLGTGRYVFHWFLASA